MMQAIARAGCLALLLPAATFAQHSHGITDEEMLTPWREAIAAIGRLQADDTRLAQPLDRLDAALAELQARLEDTAVSIVARPEFSYDATQWSEDLSREVGKAGSALEEVFAAAGKAGEGRAACDGIARLQAALAQRTPFERDVLMALGSGSKHAIQALARRWWMVSEGVEDLREAAARHFVTQPRSTMEPFIRRTT